MKALRTIGIVILVGVIGFLGYTYLGGRSATIGAETIPTVTAEVRRGTIEEFVSATGNVAAERQSTLAFETSGRVEDLLAEEGDEVAVQQLLAKLDTGATEDQVARAEASLRTAQARLDQAKLTATESELASAQASVTSAEASLSKMLEGPTEKDLQSAQFSVETAKNQLWAAQAQRDSTAGNRMSTTGAVDAAEAQVLSAEVSVQQALLAQAKLLDPPTEKDIAAAQSQVAQAEAQLAQLEERPRAEDVALAEAQYDETALALAQARDSLDDALMRAPFDGTILQVSVNVGDWASPGAPAIVIADTGELIVDVNVDELDVAQIAVGQTERLSFEALRKEEALGTVTHIAPASTNVGGAVAYQVEISFEPGDLPVRLGMTTNVDIVTAKVEDVLLVPNQTVTSDRQAGRYYVTQQISPTGTEVVEVEVGLMGEFFTQILSGVNEGDVLVLPQIEGGSDLEFGAGMPGMGMMGGFRGATGGGGR